ncbi:MAG: hypothetical protein F2555_05110 [Actinobacteria bacterium]|nr:hypothetical protein [Actinomycetota bacterium]
MEFGLGWPDVLGVGLTVGFGDGMRSFSMTVTLIFCPGLRFSISKDPFDESLPGLGLISRFGFGEAVGFGVGS